MVLNGKSWYEYSVNAGVAQGSIHDPTFFLLCINDFSDDVICNIAIYTDDTMLTALTLIRHLICSNN